MKLAESLLLALFGNRRVGLKADINVIDMEKLRIQHPCACSIHSYPIGPHARLQSPPLSHFVLLTRLTADVAYELPTGAKIWTQDVVGYDYTIISGVITFKDNVKTGALPGGLVRNPRTHHVRDAGAVSGKSTVSHIEST